MSKKWETFFLLVCFFIWFSTEIKYFILQMTLHSSNILCQSYQQSTLSIFFTQEIEGKYPGSTNQLLDWLIKNYFGLLLFTFAKPVKVHVNVNYIKSGLTSLVLHTHTWWKNRCQSLSTMGLFAIPSGDLQISSWKRSQQWVS
jgi:hypothetical protein